MTVAFNLKNHLSGLFSVLFFNVKSYFKLENSKKVTIISHFFRCIYLFYHMLHLP